MVRSDLLNGILRFGRDLGLRRGDLGPAIVVTSVTWLLLHAVTVAVLFLGGGPRWSNRGVRPP